MDEKKKLSQIIVLKDFKKKIVVLKKKTVSNYCIKRF